MELVFGIAGPSLAGKDLAADYLAQRFGLDHIKLGDIVREETEKRGLALNKHNLHQVGNDMRQSFSPSILFDAAWRRYQQNKQKYNGLVVSDVRHPQEAKALTKVGGIIFYVDASQSSRYIRSQNRKGPEDAMSYAEFQTYEETHAHPQTKYDHDLDSVRKLATYQVDNDHDMEFFKKALESQVNIYVESVTNHHNDELSSLIQEVDKGPSWLN